MYKLYYYPGNANLAPHMVLQEIGAKYELVLLDRDKQQHKSPEYLKLNPHGRVPTLVDGDLVIYGYLPAPGRSPSRGAACAGARDARARAFL